MVRDEFKKLFVEAPFCKDIVSFYERKKGALICKLLSENTSSDKEMYEVIGALKECKNVISVINKIIEEVRYGKKG